MRKTLCMASLFLFCAAAFSQESGDWKKPFSGKDANGEGVAVLLEFKKGSETADSSANGVSVKLQGDAKFVDGGVFGGACLESFATGENKPMGAISSKKLSLKSADGRLAVESWVKLKDEPFPKSNMAVVADCKGIYYSKEGAAANSGFAMYLEKPPAGKPQIVVCLGFGDASETFRSGPVDIEPGKWTHLAFAYDGAGRCEIFKDGARLSSSTKKDRKAVADPTYLMSVGERPVSNHIGFPGFIGQLRVARFIPNYLEIPFRAALSKTKGRSVFVRMEEGARITLDVENTASADMSDVRARLALPGSEPVEVVVASGLSKGVASEVSFPVDSSLRPGSYEGVVSVSANYAGRRISQEVKTPVVIVPRPLPNTMPVINWGYGDLAMVKDLGFTQNQQHLSFNKGPDADYTALVERLRKTFDDHLAAGLLVNAQFQLNSVIDKAMKEKFTRVNKNGTPYSNIGVCASAPELKEFMGKVAGLTSKYLGDHPGLGSCILNTEVRDHSAVCFHDWDRKAWEKFPQACRDALEKGVISKTGISPFQIPGFPSNRIVPDDNPHMQFLKWWWREGDGWNTMHSICNDAMKASPMHKGFWTYYDPAVRTPSVWGSGGNVDVVSQWTYSYQEPIKIGQATDELFAMAEGRPGQNVMKMTQIIWYRHWVAPKLPEDDSKRVQWEKNVPDAKFVTIAPDHLREALWSKLSRPIKGIMYHGWESLVPVGQHLPWGYRYTNPETKDVLKSEIEKVVRPLGPTLMQVPDWQTDVALLESFSAQMLYGRGTWGWGETWECDMHMILQWAGLQPQIVYEESVAKNGLDKFKVLVMPNCDAIQESVYKKIVEFQKRGGIVIADSNLTPAIVPDFSFGPYKRIKNAKADKEALQKIAASLRASLKGVHQRKFDSDNMDVVPRLRQYKSAEYLFAVNDHRTYGGYVGQHGLVMEKGLPSKANLSIKRKNPAVYDLLAHKKVEVSASGDWAGWSADLGPGGGDVWLVMDKPIAKLKIDLPGSISVGDSAKLKVSVLNSDGDPAEAVIPVRISVVDAAGEPAERGGFYGAKDGVVEVSLDIARNDRKGEWKVSVEDLASGLKAERKFMVK